MSGDPHLEAALFTFGFYKDLGERAMAQLSDDELHWKPDAEANSVAIIVKHMAGNMRSRWTDFLTTDGEKPWRHRDNEFVDDVASREKLMLLWERGWSCLITALAALTVDDLAKTVTIRGEPHTVIQAVHRQLDH